MLFHSGNRNAHAWDAFARAMAPHFRVIAPDPRGFGATDWALVYDADAFVSDPPGLLTALRLRRVVFCGNSMGGSVSMAYASQ